MQLSQLSQHVPALCHSALPVNGPGSRCQGHTSHLCKWSNLVNYINSKCINCSVASWLPSLHRVSQTWSTHVHQLQPHTVTALTALHALSCQTWSTEVQPLQFHRSCGARHYVHADHLGQCNSFNCNVIRVHQTVHLIQQLTKQNHVHLIQQLNSNLLSNLKVKSAAKRAS